MYRRRSYDAVRKSSNQSSGPVLPGNSVTNTAPFGMGKVLKLFNKFVILSLSMYFTLPNLSILHIYFISMTL